MLLSHCWEKPWQKLAQQDSSKLQDLFSLACFMSWLIPKMEVQLGKGSDVLTKIMEMWDLGSLDELEKKATFWRLDFKVPTLLWNLNSAWWFPPLGGVGWLQPNTLKSFQNYLGSSIWKECVVEFKFRKILSAKSQVPKVVSFLCQLQKNFSALWGAIQLEQIPQHFREVAKKIRNICWTWKKPQHFKEVARKICNFI